MTNTRTPERNHPVKTDDDQLQAKIRSAENALRLVWVIAFGAIVFSMLTVTPLVQRVTPDGWDKTAPLLPLVVDAAVIIVVRMDSTISSFNAKGGFWPAALRWMTGLFTLALNVGDSALKGDLVGVGVHAVCPALLIATSEAIPRYRRTIATAVDRIRREQAAERERREQQRAAERERERQAREQQQERRERLEREAREQSAAAVREQREAGERAAREQRDHEARLAREQRDFQASQERDRQDREDARRRENEARQEELDRLQREANERREQGLREEREQAARARREQQAAAVREHPKQTAEPVREQRPLHAVNTPAPRPANTPKAKPVNNEKVDEADAVNMIQEAVNTGSASVRGLARSTGWSPAWVSGKVAELRGDTDSAAPSDEEEQVSA